MQQIKSFLNLLDIIAGTFWGLTVIEIIPIISSGSAYILSSLDNVIKIAFSLVGLIYTIVRMVHFIQISKLNRDYRRQEVIEKLNANDRNNKEK